MVRRNTKREVLTRPYPIKAGPPRPRAINVNDMMATASVPVRAETRKSPEPKSSFGNPVDNPDTSALNF